MLILFSRNNKKNQNFDYRKNHREIAWKALNTESKNSFQIANTYFIKTI